MLKSYFSRIGLLATTLLLGSAVLPAQMAPRKGALPQGFEWIEAFSFNHMPFGLKVGRCQQLWSKAGVPGTKSFIMIREIMIRRDRTGSACGAFWVECEMGFSSAKTNPLTPSPTFANNRNQDYTLVFIKKKLNLPASAVVTGQNPQPWLPTIALDKPFMFQRLKSTGLLWEIKVFSTATTSPGSSFTLDAHSPKVMMIGNPSGRGPAGCAGTKGGNPLYCNAFCYLGPAGSFYKITSQYAAPNTPMILVLGQSSSEFGNIPLPFDLTPLGATGCKVYTDIWIPIGTTADGQGSATTQFPVPFGFSEGFPVYAQAYALAPGVNPMGLAASNCAICYTSQVVNTGMVYNTSSATATTGTASKNMGIVLGIGIF